MPLLFKTERRTDGWWVTGLPNGEDMGPYRTQDEANSDRVGVQKFYRHKDEPHYITVDKKDN